MLPRHSFKKERKKEKKEKRRDKEERKPSSNKRAKRKGEAEESDSEESAIPSQLTKTLRGPVRRLFYIKKYFIVE